jgi:Tubulin folding cofactor D C terminal
MYNALISGLEDYTTDERGDVGSWVRIASIQGLTSVSLTLLTLANSDVTYTEYIPANLYQKAISGILKQGVERLDNVRQQAGENVVRLLRCPVPIVNDSNAWKFHGEELFKGLLLRYELSDFLSPKTFLIFFEATGQEMALVSPTVGKIARGYSRKRCTFWKFRSIGQLFLPAS